MPITPEVDFLQDQFLSKLEDISSLQTKLLDQDLESLADQHNLIPHKITLLKKYLNSIVAHNGINLANELILNTVL
jgi:hypothetical protein